MILLTPLCTYLGSAWTSQLVELVVVEVEVGEVRLEHTLKAGGGRQDRRAATDHHITRYKRGAIGAATAHPLPRPLARGEIKAWSR